MEHKFRNEIHANEIVLLAYYIAAINIEAVYHGLQGGDYVPFEGICLTDTFQMYESDDLISHYMPDNSERRKRQKATDIRVIVGNPPYSSGQNNANDNNANVAYPTLDGRIRDTYAAKSSATNKNALYDSYIRAIRWASDRIGDAGVMAYVSNAGWVDGNAADGLRACLADEFSDLYVFHLRGNARTSGEQRRKERGNVFGEGTRTPIAISVLVKNPDATQRGRIHFHDIGDYLDQKQKLAIIRDFGSIGGIAATQGWTQIEPDEHSDWLKQRDGSFDAFIKIGDKKDRTEPVLFENYSSGVKTQRDAWCYNFSRADLARNIGRTVAFYNDEMRRVEGITENIDDLLNTDPAKISWTRALRADISRKKPLAMDQGRLVPSLYRPFTKEWLYFGRRLNEMVYQMPRLFPEERQAKIAIIMISKNWPGEGKPLPLMVDQIPELQTDGRNSVLPAFHFYNCGKPTSTDDLFASQGTSTGFRTSDGGITDAGLKHFQDAYPGETNHQGKTCSNPAYGFLGGSPRFRGGSMALLHSRGITGVFWGAPRRRARQYPSSGGNTGPTNPPVQGNPAPHPP